MMHDFLPMSRRIWKNGAGTSVISFMYAATPMWITRPSATPS